MPTYSHKALVVAALALVFVGSPGCAKQQADTVPPNAERGGAGADGNNSAPESLSNGGADPETTPLTEPSTPPAPAPAPDPDTGTPAGEAPTTPPK